MKFSKVDHTMTAVTKVDVEKQEAEISGIIYDNPEKAKVEQKAKKEGKSPVRQRVDELNGRAQNLYAILNASTKLKFIDSKDKDKMNQKERNKEEEREKKEKAYCGAVRTEVNRLVKGWAHNVYSQAKKLDNSLRHPKQKINGKDFPSIKAKRRRELIKLLIEESIRKSFCKEIIRETGTESIRIYLPDVVEKLILAIYGMGEGLSEVEKEVFLDVLNKDYAREEQLENISKSIERQNVKVQVQKADGMVKLQLSNAQHKRKRYIFQFIKEFASADKAEQDQMFLYIKKLMVLFFCGVGKYEHLGEEEISNWGFALNLEDDCYSSEVRNLIYNRKECGDKLERKKINEEIKKNIKSRIYESYNEGKAYFKEKYQVTEEPGGEEYEKAVYWLSYIAEAAERLLVDKRKVFLMEEAALSAQYLCEYTWQEWLSFICMKYVDMGKAVYHFAMPEDLSGVSSAEDTVIGEVRPQFTEGITSFDYERIQAKENFDREISRYVVFAINNFATAVLNDKERSKNKEDVLDLSGSDIDEYLREDAVKRMLQFFGGRSRWMENGKYKIKDFEDRNAVFEAVKQELAAVRNSSFHYTATTEESRQGDGLIEAMFHKEYGEAGQMFRKKYYSNNVPMFYSVKDIDRLMDALYQKAPERLAQIPSYERILKRSKFAEFVQDEQNHINTSDVDRMDTTEVEKFRSALYFVLKQIYYYGFLQDKSLKDKFIENVNDYKKKAENIPDRKYAAINFNTRLKEITESDKKITFGAICQQIMTDYNMQNNRDMTVEVSQADRGNSAEEDKKLYDHFPMILYECIKNAFVQYLGEHEDIFGFVKKPKDNRIRFENLREEDFCQGWKVNMYEKVLDSTGQMAWYTMAHFLEQQQLNRMIGTIKSHIQFLGDIDKRERLASQCKSSLRQAEAEKPMLEEYKKIVEVLQFSMLFCEQMTNEAADYFRDEEEYANHLAKYVKFEDEALKGKQALKAFCSREVKDGGANGRIGLYYDELNPIVSKNVAKTMMYGNGKLLESCVEPITEEEIRGYYEGKAALEKVFKAGKCVNKWEQTKLKSFQNMKNRIEFTNLSVYMQIINELVGQLVSWAYLRERDLMYFQLGYYYTKIYHGNSIAEDDSRRMVKGDGFGIADGAILYQIAAMNTYYLPMFELKDGVAKLAKPKGSIGAGVGAFLKTYTEDTYCAGLQLFERRSNREALNAEHKEIVSFRNYIDHFKYFSSLDRSIMDLYSMMFDGFFSYSSKLHRSVPVVFQNILARYFVIADVNIGTKEICCFRDIKKDKKNEINKINKIKENRASITLKARKVKDKKSKDGKSKDREMKAEKLSSSSFTYKFPGKTKDGKEYLKPVPIPARGEIFLQELEKILEYSCSK